MKHPIKTLAFLFVFIATSAFAQPEPTLFSSDQNSEPTFSPDGVWHKNMELIRPVALPNQPWGEHSQAVTINDKKYFLSTHDAAGIRLTDVTNPRSPSVALTITADFKNDDDDDNDLDVFAVKFRTNEVWAENHDEITGELNGHVFAIVEVGWSPTINTHINKITITRDVDDKTVLKARLLIIDLTEALALIASPGGSTTSIHINDVVDRNSAHRVGVTENSNMIHIGYIPTDATTVKDRDDNVVPTIDRIHTLNLERNIGMLVISPVDTRKVPVGVVENEFAGFIDLFDLSVLVDHTDVSSTTILMKPDRIMSDGLPIIVKTTPDAIDTEPIYAHETDIHRTRELMHGMPTNTFVPGKVDVAVAGFARNKRHLGEAAIEQSPGGAVIMEIDYSSSKTSAVCSLIQHWQYDPDRESPSSKTSSNTNWSWRPVHSVDGLHFDHENHLYLTTEEIATPQFKPGTTSLTTRTDVINGNYFSNFTQPLHFEDVTSFDDPTEDHRRLGAYMRIWLSSMDHRKIEGSGSNNSAQASGGPCGSYDIPEQSPTDRANELKNPALGNDEITRVDCSTSDDERAPNTTHHVRTMYGSLGRLPESSSETDQFSLRTEAYIAAYSQGVRVIDMRNFIDPEVGFNDGDLPNPVADVIERAYFDFIPTLNYDPDSRFFYANAPGGANNFYDGQLVIENYFIGPIDAYPDMPVTDRPTGIQPDENFLYTYGFVGKQGPWLQDGGFMILRYFRDKIGGTITGYSGTNVQNDMAFRDVNLQGTFSVERNTIVAGGATVNLLEDTHLNQKPSGTESLTIDGTVNIKTIADAGRGTINVPVIVHNGGKLVIKSGAVIDFTKKVTVDIGGELTIENGAKVVFANEANVCNGKFLVNGTTTSRVKIFAALNTGRTSTVGNSFFTMKGNPAQLSLSKLQIKFADVENVCFDAVDIKPGTPEMITQSTFSAHTTSIKPYLVSYQRKFYANLSDAITPVKVTFSTFKDRNRACLDYEESHSGRYESCINQSHGFHGIAFTNVNFAEISNSNFSHLMTGTYLDKGFIINVKSCTLSYSNRGIISVSNAPIICTNIFHGVEQGFQGISTLAAFVYDNKVFKSSIAGLNISGATHFYRGNRFEDYCTGLVGWNASLQLRDHVSNDVWNKLGRNQFITTDPALIETSDSIPVYGIYGCSVNDIHLVNSRLLIHCGFNYLSKFSALHVFTGGTGTFDPSYNHWDDVGGSIIRTDAVVAGSPLNTSQTVGASCNRENVEVPCPVSACTQGIYLIEYIGQDSIVQASYNGVWNNVKDSTLSLDCRKIAAHELAEMAITLDSDLYYTNTIVRLDSVYAKTSNPPILRSTALMLKGSLLERMDSTSAALYAYSNIVTNFTSYPDSIPAAWRIQYLNAVLDTVNYDSLIREYHIRVLNDTRRMTFIDDPAYKMAGQMPDHQTSGIEATISLEQNVPNPWDSHTDISFTLPVSGFITLKVIDILGNEVKTLVNGEGKAGRNLVSFKASDMPEGIYFYRLQYGNQVITKKMQKNR